MISSFNSPGVCVIDDEAADYEPFRDALNGLHIGNVHFKGQVDEWPEQPFSGVRLVFQDLHLTAATGKTAASHAANFFCKLISRDTAPVVVVIWSKYAGQKVGEPGAPPAEEQTEAQLFIQTLEDAEPAFKGRLVFVEMSKPPAADRPKMQDWIKTLQANIQTALQDLQTVGALWHWEAAIQRSGFGICRDVTSLAADIGAADISAGLKATLQVLVQAQGGKAVTRADAPSHLTAALGQLLVDHLEHSSVSAEMAAFASWLGEPPEKSLAEKLAPRLNGLLLTAEPPTPLVKLMPGAVCRVTNPEAFKKEFNAELQDLVNSCFCGKSTKRGEWDSSVKPVVVELSPSCEAAQDKRLRSFLVAGLIVPSGLRESTKDKDAWFRTPLFYLRKPAPGLNQQDVVLVICARFTSTSQLLLGTEWLEPWFRFRDSLAGSLRHQYASWVARVGFTEARG